MLYQCWQQQHISQCVNISHVKKPTVTPPDLSRAPAASFTLDCSFCFFSVSLLFYFQSVSCCLLSTYCLRVSPSSRAITSLCPLCPLSLSFSFDILTLSCALPDLHATFLRCPWHLSAIIRSGNCCDCLGLCFCLLVCRPCVFFFSLADTPKAESFLSLFLYLFTNENIYMYYFKSGNKNIEL